MVPKYSLLSYSISCKLAAAAAKSLQSCLTLCDPIDGSPPGSPVPGILQARTLEWVAISFSIAWKWKVKVTLLSPVWLLATPWTAAHQAPSSVGFSRWEYWSELPLPSPDLATNILIFSRSVLSVCRAPHWQSFWCAAFTSSSLAYFYSTVWPGNCHCVSIYSDHLLSFFFTTLF